METNAAIIPMGEGTWRIEDGGVRFFVLAGNQKALLIDSGMTVRNAKEIAESLTDLPLSLCNTHADRDHVGSNAQFLLFYMHPAEEEHYRKEGGKGKILPVRDGDILDLGDRPLRIIGLPGHTPGSIALLDVKNRALISGDPIQENGRIFMFGEHRNLATYIESLEKLLKEHGEEFDEIWPSHASIPVSPARIPGLIEGAKKILTGSLSGESEEMFGHPILAYDLGFTTLLTER